VTILKNLRTTWRKITSYEITKRQKLILMSFFLSVILLATQTVGEDIRYQVMGFMVVATAFLAVFSLWGELSGIKYFLLLLLPIYFVAGASLFYFLLPVRWLTRLPYAFLFAISIYLLMLTSNIYNVAAIRTIALLRAAHAVGLLFSLIATFFLVNVLFSLHLPFYLLVAGIVVVTFPLYLVSLWSYELEEFISRRVFIYALVFTFVSSQIAIVLSFWPIMPINGALSLATIMYVLLGLARLDFEERLNRRVAWEHVAVAFVVLVIILMTTRWGG